MCAIVDANVAGEVFGNNPSEAGKYFLEWLNSKGRIAVGGHLLLELTTHQNFVKWLGTATRVGRARKICDQMVVTEAEALRVQAICRSDDFHVLALARVSKARLLFTNDIPLQQDFGDFQIVNSPRGRVYTTLLFRDVTDTHKRLLRRNDLCNI